MADLVVRQPEDVGVLQEAGWEDVIARQQVAYAAACENFRILRRKYDALKECHTELLWSRAVVDAEGLGADLAADAPVAEADGVVGGTALGRELGRGASSVVFEGRTADGSPCAVKRIAKASAKTLREVRTIGAECEALRALSAGGATPALVATMSTPKFLYVVTDLFGEELYGHVRARGLLGPRPRLQVFAGVAAALARMHEAGYAHRDVKPENVLVDFRGDAVEVKLCDLGLAAKLPDAPRFAFDGGPPGASPDSVFASLGQYAQPNHGPLFRCCGSMGFFAPDMLDVRGYDATRTDVWSLGCLGLELALGSRVFADFWFVAYKTFFAAPRGAGDEAGPFSAAPQARRRRPREPGRARRRRLRGRAAGLLALRGPRRRLPQRGAGRAALRGRVPRPRRAPGPDRADGAPPRAATTARAYDVIRGLARPSSAPRAPSLLDAALT
ncbi:serine/threonine kinase [Aureococcus anophagefferens]|nr:serine/threonine kinase [Aureococcus anophagefferens]